MRRLPVSRCLLWRPLLLLALVFLFAPPADADLVGRSTPPMTSADAANTALIEANPFLNLLASENPELLRSVLGFMRDRPQGVKRGAQLQGAPEPLTEREEQLLEENPVFKKLYRSSPEAFLDLLRLIREAAKKQ